MTTTRDGEQARPKAQRGPKSLLGDDPRDRLYRVAVECFERSGIRRTSMDEVAQAAGVSRPTIYYYFANKEALVLEVVAREAGKILAAVSATVEGATPLDRIVEAAVSGVGASLVNQYVRMLIAPDSAALTSRLLETDTIMRLQREFWHPLLRDAVEAGELRSDEDLDAIMEWIIFLMFSVTTHGEAFGLDREEVIRARLRAFLRPALTG